MSVAFINAVTTAYPYPEETAEWVQKALRPNDDRASIEEQAASLLDQIEEKNPRTDKTRYQFNHEATNREKLLTTIFQLSFKAKPDSIIDAATSYSPETPYYPKWKKVCFIQIPKIAVEVLKNPLFQLAVVIASMYFSYKACHLAYRATVSLVTKIAPEIITRAPRILTQAINTLSSLSAWVHKNKGTLAIGALLVHQVATRAIEIPYLSPRLRRISLTQVIGSLVTIVLLPQTISSFALFTALEVSRFADTTCKNLANSIKSKVSQIDSARLALSKEKVYAVWKNLTELARAV